MATTLFAMWVSILQILKEVIKCYFTACLLQPCILEVYALVHFIIPVVLVPSTYIHFRHTIVHDTDLTAVSFPMLP